jgi:RNA polymerase sigma-70 factor, ECF subfamily
MDGTISRAVMKNPSLHNGANGCSDARVQQFVRLLTQNERCLKSYILSLVPNLADTEQILQETNLRLWAQFSKFDPTIGGFAAWARTIARYQVLTFRKEANRERVIFNSDFLDTLAERAEARTPQLAARQEALINCVNKLPDRSRELIRYYYLAEMKVRAAAEKLGRTVAATEKAIVRVRRILYDCVMSALARDGLAGDGLKREPK